jgi:hypothetical protein
MRLHDGHIPFDSQAPRQSGLWHFSSTSCERPPYPPEVTSLTGRKNKFYFKDGSESSTYTRCSQHQFLPFFGELGLAVESGTCREVIEWIPEASVVSMNKYCSVKVRSYIVCIIERQKIFEMLLIRCFLALQMAHFIQRLIAEPV